MLLYIILCILIGLFLFNAVHTVYYLPKGQTSFSPQATSNDAKATDTKSNATIINNDQPSKPTEPIEVETVQETAQSATVSDSRESSHEIAPQNENCLQNEVKTQKKTEKSLSPIASLAICTVLSFVAIILYKYVIAYNSGWPSEDDNLSDEIIMAIIVPAALCISYNLSRLLSCFEKYDRIPIGLLFASAIGLISLYLAYDLHSEFNYYSSFLTYTMETSHKVLWLILLLTGTVFYSTRDGSLDEMEVEDIETTPGVFSAFTYKARDIQGLNKVFWVWYKKNWRIDTFAYDGNGILTITLQNGSKFSWNKSEIDVKYHDDPKNEGKTEFYLSNGKEELHFVTINDLLLEGEWANIQKVLKTCRSYNASGYQILDKILGKLS